MRCEGCAMSGYGRGAGELPDFERYPRRPARPASLAPKDYSVPLHVDCSIEYELPDCAKPPQGVKIEPLLMIHPAHFRRLESLRRVPFVNNLPTAPAAAPSPAPGRAPRTPRRCCRAPSAAVAAPAAAVVAPPAPDYRLLLDELLAPRWDGYGAPYAAPAEPAKSGAPGKAAASRPRTLKAHPYLPEGAAAECAPHLPYERFDKRRTLPQLPIYM